MSNAKVLPLSGSEESIQRLIFIRNIQRFPSDFMFRLSRVEMAELVTNCDRFKTLKHASQPSLAFTENGVAMLSSVLNSEYAIKVNIQIMRTFTQIREYLTKHKDLEKRLDDHIKECRGRSKTLFQAMNQLLDPPVNPNKRPIGFHV